MTRRTVLVWLACVVLVYGVALGLTVTTGETADPLRLAVAVVLAGAATGVVLSAAAPRSRLWQVPATTEVRPTGRDPLHELYARLLEDHRREIHPDGALQRRLAALAERQLARRQVTSREDPQAADLLGREVLDLLSGPPRLLTRTQIETVVARIEEL